MTRCKALTWAVILVLLSSRFAFAGQETEKSPPPLPLAAPAETVAPAPVELRAGVVIARMTMQGEVKGDLARMRITADAESFRDGEQHVVLLPSDLAITDWSVKGPFFGPSAYIRRSKDAVELVVTGKGKFSLSLELVLSVTRERMGHKIILPIMPALVARTQVVVPGADLEFKAEPGVSLEMQAQKERSAAVIYGGAGPVTLTWMPKAPEKVLKPMVFADQTLRARIGQGVLRLDSTIDYSIVQGAVRELEVAFPGDCSLLSIQGKDIRTWDVAEPKEGEPRTLKVTLLGDVEKEYRLALRLEKVLPSVKMEIDLPVIEPLNVVREKGRVAVSAAKGISVETVSLKEISHVDVLEMALAPDLPPPTEAGYAKAGAVEEMKLGFRYLKRPFALTLRTGEVVAKTSAQILSLVRAGMDSMRVTSSVLYTIRDAGVFQFRVKLDERQKLIDIVGANINNWQMDETGRILTVTLRSKAEGSYQLQIETEVEKPVADKAPVPALHALDVDREAGYIALLPAPGMKVETATLTGISQVDVKELPEDLLRQSPALAYRYIRPDYAVAINISEIEPEVQAEVQTVAVLDEHELALRTEVRYAIRRAGIFQVRVAIPKELRRRNVEGADIDDTSWDEERGILTVNLRNKVSDQYLLRIDADQTLKGLETGAEVAMPVIHTVDVKKERGFLAVNTKASVRLKPAEGKMGGLEDVSASDLPPEMLQRAGQVALAFKYYSQPWTLALAVERIEPRVTAEVFNLLSIGEKLVTVSATVRYTILHAGEDTFVIRVPAGATAVEIDGEGIKHREEDKTSNTWTVTTQSKRTDSYTIYMNFQQKLSRSDIPYAGVEALKTERETGYVAVTSRADIELKVADQDIENLTAMDSREIPRNYMEGVSLPVLLAFRYVSHPYTIRMGALSHDAAEVTIAVVESARLSTTVTEEGNMITDVVCMLRNSRQQYLDLQLPKDARIWHAFVAGESVTPLQDQGLTKIPVARVAGSRSAFEIRLRYGSNGVALGRVGSLRLDSPLKDIDIMRIGWTLSLPEGYDIVRDLGTIRQLDNLGEMEGVLQNLNPDAQVEVPAFAQSSEGVNVSAQILMNREAQQRVQQDSKGNKAQVSSIYTGSKPTQRRVFFFQGLIVSGKEPAMVRAQYVKSSLGLPLAGVVVLGVALSGLAIWRLRGYRRATRFGIVISGALIVLAVRTLTEGAYRGFLTTVVVTLAVIAGAMLICSVATKLRDAWQWRRTPAAEVKAPKQTPGPETPG